MFFKNLFKKEEKPINKEEKPINKETINVKDFLTDNEINLLITDLGLIRNKVDSQSSYIVSAAIELVESRSNVKPQLLDLFIAAVQSALDMYSMFNMVPSGTATLLEKLQSAKENYNK